MGFEDRHIDKVLAKHGPQLPVREAVEKLNELRDADKMDTLSAIDTRSARKNTSPTVDMIGKWVCGLSTAAPVYNLFAVAGRIPVFISLMADFILYEATFMLLSFRLFFLKLSAWKSNWIRLDFENITI